MLSDPQAVQQWLRIAEEYEKLGVRAAELERRS
jgi:hypothetical protein